MLVLIDDQKSHQRRRLAACQVMLFAGFLTAISLVQTKLLLQVINWSGVNPDPKSSQQEHAYGPQRR
jgi:hypothetical protein